MIIAQMWDDNRTDVGWNIIHLWDSRWFETPIIVHLWVNYISPPPPPKVYGETIIAQHLHICR